MATHKPTPSRIHPPITADTIHAAYRQRTPASAAFLGRAAQAMPGGSTRSYGFHEPYPLTFTEARGARLHDIDGNEYLDFSMNGWSLIHGHAHPRITAALDSALACGTAWPGPSPEQVELAELLCSRIPTVERVRFTSSGTEAAMLATKIARRVTGRPLILKAIGGYHGSFDDLESGLFGIGPVEGKTLLARFGDANEFEQLATEHSRDLAAIILEPALCTGVLTKPPTEFLGQVQAIARAVGALFILDDCLLFRLSLGGSQERLDLQPDLTVLGKFVGGGIPMGVVGGPEAIMACLDPRAPEPLYHGGSFNGAFLGAVAGLANLQALTSHEIDEMERRTTSLVHRLSALSSPEAPVSVVQIGSTAGVYMSSHVPRRDEPYDQEADQLFRLACANHGIYLGSTNDIALSTVVTDDDIEMAADAMSSALEDLTSQPAAV